VTSKSANYTLVAADNGRIIPLTGATGRTFTIANVLPIGGRVDFVQDGTGAITFAAGAGATIQSKGGKLSTSGPYAGATILCIGSGQYRLIGDLS
jgi:hypothetical protein